MAHASPTVTTRLANRYGVDIVFHDNADGSSTTNDITVDYANEVAVEITSDAVTATSGQAGAPFQKFNNPLSGTMTITTQVITPQLLKLITGEDTTAATTSATFASKNANESGKTYKITGTTIWKGTIPASGSSGTATDDIFAETFTAYKATILPAYNVTYNGSGDPQTITFNIELSEDENGMYTTSFAQAT